MASTRIEIENVRGLWVAEAELPRVNGGIVRHRIRSATREDCFRQLEKLFRPAELTAKPSDARMGEQAIALKGELEERRQAGVDSGYILLSEDEFETFIKSGAGLDAWERRTPGKPLMFEGAIFGLPLDKPYAGEKWSWRPVNDSDVEETGSSSVEEDEAPAAEESDELPLVAVEEAPKDPTAPNHAGRATAQGYWKKCRCAACENMRDQANSRPAAVAA